MLGLLEAAIVVELRLRHKVCSAPTHMQRCPAAAAQRAVITRSGTAAIAAGASTAIAAAAAAAAAAGATGSSGRFRAHGVDKARSAGGAAVAEVGVISTAHCAQVPVIEARRKLRAAPDDETAQRGRCIEQRANCIVRDAARKGDVKAARGHGARRRRRRNVTRSRRDRVRLREPRQGDKWGIAHALVGSETRSRRMEDGARMKR